MSRAANTLIQRLSVNREQLWSEGAGQGLASVATAASLPVYRGKSLPSLHTHRGQSGASLPNQNDSVYMCVHVHVRACVYTSCSLDTRVYVAQIHGLIITCTVWECIWRVIISNPKLVRVGTTLLMFNGTNTNMHTSEQSLCPPGNYPSIMSSDAINALLGGGVRVRVRVQRKFKGNIKGTTKPLMAILDSTQGLGMRLVELSKT